MSKKVENMS